MSGMRTTTKSVAPVLASSADRSSVPSTDSALSRSRMLNRPSLTPTNQLMMQRSCGCSSFGGHQGPCDECKKKKTALLRSPQAGHDNVAQLNSEPTLPASVHRTLQSSGQALEPSVRASMEDSFGHDFSNVRVHQDAQAAQSARDVNARAYAVGQHVVFDQGQYQPHTPQGAHLLAHELAHTVQQSGLQRQASHPSSIGQGALAIAAENDPAERQARAAADMVINGQRPDVNRMGASEFLGRVPWGKCPDGKVISAQPSNINQAAELSIVDYYLSTVPHKKLVLTNRNLIEQLAQSPPRKHRPMIKAMEEMFRTFKPGGPRQPTILPAEQAYEVPNPDLVETGEGETESESTLNLIEGKSAAYEDTPNQPLRPDIADFEKREVYDVTTLRQAPEKVGKVANDYVKRLNVIRDLLIEKGKDGGKEWTAGTSLARPPARYLLYQSPGQPALCFGSTDFEQRPGVLSYEPIVLPEGQKGIVSEPYDIANSRGDRVTVDAQVGLGVTDLLNSGPNNLAASQLIPGLILKSLKRQAKGVDRIVASLPSQVEGVSTPKPPLPISLLDDKGEIELKVDPKSRVLSLAKNYTGKKFKSKYLSQGQLKKLQLDAEGNLAGTGTLVPSLKIFRGATFGISFSHNYYAITEGLEPDKLKKILKPFPGVKVTRADIELQLYETFQPKGILEMEWWTGKRKILDASAELSLSSSGGLRATGKLTAHLPGEAKAEGEVVYENDSWSASAKIESTKLGLPYVKSGMIEAGVTPKGVYGGGVVDLEIDGGHTAELKFHYGSGAWYFSGRGNFNIRRLGRKAILTVSYFDGKVLKANGVIKDFEFSKVRGDLSIHYEGRPGARPKIWGSGLLTYRKDKISGSLQANLLETGKFTGSGSLSYELRPGLIAQAGIALDENENVKITGSLTFPDYTLIKRFPEPPNDRFDIFTFGPKRVGVPYLSFGPVGLKAQISAGIFANYGIGPVVLTGGYIKTVIDNPLSEDATVDLELGGRIKVPASFSVTGFISGGLVLDVFIAEAGGRLRFPRRRY